MSYLVNILKYIFEYQMSYLINIFRYLDIRYLTSTILITFMYLDDVRYVLLINTFEYLVYLINTFEYLDGIQPYTH